MEIQTYIYYNYALGAAEECRLALFALGFSNFSIKGQRGSHSAIIYVFGEEEEKFINEIIGNVIIGQNRKFYFSYSYGMFGEKDCYFNVSYGRK